MRWRGLEGMEPAERRAFLIYYTRVMLREYRARRGQRGIEWMLHGAGKARRQAFAIDVRPTQAELFA